ncbi:uncharacterized protein LOC62_01G000135 [Vanrija pseudolonga]|uniref:Uncharacterized protein n=1 Tax=Vanrija pseudolonga TaxID=143232 RepID=A0AAF0XZ40_9TREE|nr:hypothetical protein LOC62_01G000135 [Vanrija pseudolonga]
MTDANLNTQASHQREAATFVALLSGTYLVLRALLTQAARGNETLQALSDTRYHIMLTLGPRICWLRRAARNPLSSMTLDQRNRVLAVSDGHRINLAECIDVMMDIGLIGIDQIQLWISELSSALEVVVAARVGDSERGEVAHAALRNWTGSTSLSRFNAMYTSYQDTMTWLSEIVMATEYRVHWPVWATVPLRMGEDVSAKLRDENAWYKIYRCIHIMMDMEKISCDDIDPKIQRVGEALGEIADRIVDEQDERHGFYYNVVVDLEDWEEWEVDSDAEEMASSPAP